LHYGAALAVAKAVEAAGSTDVLAVRKAFPKAYPLLGDQIPATVFGMTADGRQKMMCSTQEVNKDGKLEPPKLEVWWAKTDKEFEAIRKAVQDPKNSGVTDPKAPLTPVIRMKAEDYKGD
jgi:hypothetical protein